MGNCQTKSKDKYTNKIAISEEKNYTIASKLHSGSILSLANCYPDDKLIVSSSDDGKIAFFNYKQNNITNIRYGESHTKAVNRVCRSKNFVWSVSRDLSLQQWNLNGNNISIQKDIHTLNTSSVAVTNDELKIITGSRDYCVKVWDTETKSLLHRFYQPRNIVTFLALGCDNSLCYQGSEDLCVRVWDDRSNSTMPAQMLKDFVYFPLCGNVDSSGNYLATGCKGFNGVGCEVKIWDLRISKVVEEMKSVHQHDVVACEFIQSNNSVLSVSKDGTICMWQVSSEPNQLTKIISTNPKASQSSDKIFTSMSIIRQEKDSKNIEVCVGSFDGSLSFYSMNSEDKSSNDDTIILTGTTMPHTGNLSSVNDGMDNSDSL